MKKKILNFIMVIIYLILILFLLSGCTNQNNNKEKKTHKINTIESEENIVGEWKAIKTDNDTYSLGWLYGTGLTYGNKLEFNENGTYTLELGLTYWQTGNFKINGTTIILTQNEYEGDNPDKKIVEKLTIDDNQIILEETEGTQKVNVIFSNIEDIENSSNSNISTSDNKITTNSENSNTYGKLKIGNKTIKYGTYTGIDAATGETLIIKNNNKAILNGITYKYEVGKYNFAQDSSKKSYKDAIILKNDDGSIAFSLYVADDGSLKSDPIGYVYNED